MIPPLPWPPIEPPATPIQFPDTRRIGRFQAVAEGADFRAGTLLSAYRAGIFPWPQPDGSVPWCAPDPRAIFPLDAPPHWARSLRRTLRLTGLTITVDTAFEAVMRACGDTRPEGTWIAAPLVAGFVELHRLGWAHSVEAWETSGGGRELVGGIYGLALGGAFVGESMFHRRTDASKIAFASLVARLRASEFSVFDVQVQNPHLASLGCVEIPRREYVARLTRAVAAGPRQLREPDAVQGAGARGGADGRSDG